MTKTNLLALAPEAHDLALSYIKGEEPPKTLAASDGAGRAMEDGTTLVIGLYGLLTPRGSLFGTSTQAFAEQVRRAADDDRVGAIVLDVDSPGGFVYGTEEAAAAVFEARNKKPVVAVANSMAASAAYWIASQASALYGAPGSDVGSIGVYSVHMDYSRALDAEGVTVELISAGERKVEGNPYRPLTDEGRANMQIEVNESYREFLQAVARGRGEQVQTVAGGSWGQGASVNAKRAAGVGMIDGVMTMREVLGMFSKPKERKSLYRRKAYLAGLLSR